MNSETLQNGCASVEEPKSGESVGAAGGASSEVESREARRMIEAAIAMLAQGEELLRTVPSASYSSKVPAAFNASIGGHLRHSLDHFASLFRGLEVGEVNYDHRDRDPRIESEPEYARAVTRGIMAQLDRLPLASLRQEVRVRCQVSYIPGESPVTRSTFGRELVYVIAHAIHHFALMGVITRILGVQVPEHFGVAPSTVSHLNGQGAR